MVIELKLRKIGNSQGVLIPNVLLEDSGLKEGDTIPIELNSDKTKLCLKSKKS